MNGEWKYGCAWDPKRVNKGILLPSTYEYFVLRTCILRSRPLTGLDGRNRLVPTPSWTMDGTTRP